MVWVRKWLRALREACFPTMTCRRCRRESQQYDDGLCASCWWDGE